MKFTGNESSPLPTEDDLLLLEERTGPLPFDYRTFLLRENGGDPDPAQEIRVPGEAGEEILGVTGFLRIPSGGSAEDYDRLTRRWVAADGSARIPIAQDGRDGSYFLSLDPAERGAIHHHDKSRGRRRVAGSFTGFLGKLRNVVPELVPADAPQPFPAAAPQPAPSGQPLARAAIVLAIVLAVGATVSAYLRRPHFSGGAAGSIEVVLNQGGTFRIESDEARAKLMKLLRSARRHPDHKCAETGRIVIRYVDGDSDEIEVLAGHEPDDFEFRRGGRLFRLSRGAVLQVLESSGVKVPPPAREGS